MGLDIYAGTLTRYYSHNWKTITQQLSEENGQHYKQVDENGNEIKPVDDIGEIEQIRDVICQWSDGLASNIDASMKTPLWDEKRESEYFTDKPDWEAFGALVMLQACRLLNRPVPECVESGWDAFDEPVVKEAMSQIRDCSLLSEVTLWLPIPKDIIFTTTLPSGNEASISTLTVLKNELEVLNQKMWKADVATILSWRNEKYYVPLKSKKPKLILGFIRGKNHAQKEKYSTEELAQCAYSMLYQATCFGMEQQVPLLLDY